MKPNKKKPRIRNRPRNKANRGKNDTEDIELQNDEVHSEGEETLNQDNGNEITVNIEKETEQKIQTNTGSSSVNLNEKENNIIKENGCNNNRNINQICNEKQTAKTGNSVCEKNSSELTVNKTLAPPQEEKDAIDLTGDESDEDMPQLLEEETPLALENISETPMTTQLMSAKDISSNLDPMNNLQQLIKKENEKKLQKQMMMKQQQLQQTNQDQNVKNSQKTDLRKNVKVTEKKSKDKNDENNLEQNAFIQNLQKQMESMVANGNEDLPNTLMDNLQKLLNQDPVTDIVSSDDEEEYIEYIYKPRQYFLVALCNLCKSDLCKVDKYYDCSKCHMIYYCSREHMKGDKDHKQLCYALQQVNASCDDHIFKNCAAFTAEQFRSYRIVTIRKMEAVLNRTLSATEQEMILFPRVCHNVKCREYKFDLLANCPDCGMVAYCKEKTDHLDPSHKNWCKHYKLFKDIIIHQEKFGRIDPTLPTKILKDLPLATINTSQIFHKLGIELPEGIELAALTQISTAPLTAWYALKLSEQLKMHEILTIHLIGAEIEFEVDILHKWELFFLHITPMVKQLNVVFVGPELNPRNISFEQLQRTKCCRVCRKNNRTVKYYFEPYIYHDYCKRQTFLPAQLICFFNAGLYRSTGYNLQDTWPETILAAAQQKVPIVVTAYTEYETPLDMSRFVKECNRRLNVLLPPIQNSFASVKPERNFISDDDAPLMFKNYYCFVVE